VRTRRRNAPTSPTSSHSSWRLEATSTGGPGHPAGSQGSRPAADSRTQGYFRGPSPQDVALKRVMQALVPIQAYMLADIVAAIPAVDLTVEQWCEGDSESAGACCLAFAPSLNWLPCILPKPTWFSVHICVPFSNHKEHYCTRYVRTSLEKGTRTRVRTRVQYHGTRVPWYYEYHGT
jgi:hypothetical protein